jgi:excisionase family DNA binding protein
MKKEFLTINQAAKRLGVAKKTIRRWEADGKITSERTAGGHRRFDISKLESQVKTNYQKTYNLKQVVIIVLITIVITAFFTFLVTTKDGSTQTEFDSIDALNSLPDDLELLESLPSPENL